MEIAVLGVNYKTAPVEVRERIALSSEACRSLVSDLTGLPDIGESVVLSTCNRTEVYVCGEPSSLQELTLRRLCDHTGVALEDLGQSVYYLEDREAIRHLFLVGGSLDSMVVGEAQILHQLKESYGAAEEAGATGAILNRLLRRSFQVGKRVRTETGIGESSLSIASVSVDLARNVFGDLKNRKVLVIGAGEMAELVVTHLKGQGADEIMVANRTYERAVALAEKFGGTAVRYASPSGQGEGRERGGEGEGHPHNQALAAHLSKADIVITSTGSTKPIISRGLMEEVMHRRKKRPVFLIDIAVPRNVEATVNEVYSAYLYDIDDLQDVVDSNLNERHEEAIKARDIVEEEVEHFEEWLSGLSVVPTVVELREWAGSVKEEEVEKFLARMPDLTEDERNKVSALAHSIVNKIMHPPTVRLKEAAGDEDVSRHEESIRYLFHLNGKTNTRGEGSSSDEE